MSSVPSFSSFSIFCRPWTKDSTKDLVPGIGLTMMWVFGIFDFMRSLLLYLKALSTSLILVPIGCSHLNTSRFQTAAPYSPSQPLTKNHLRRDNLPDLPSLHWPVDEARLTQQFRPLANPHHEGIDLAAARKTPILAAHDGIVIYAGNGYSGYGRVIIVEYNKSWASLYAHLDTYQVREGETVHSGQQIGTMGRSGRTTGVHLHFELIKNKQPINPLDHLPHNETLAQK